MDELDPFAHYYTPYREDVPVTVTATIEQVRQALTDLANLVGMDRTRDALIRAADVPKEGLLTPNQYQAVVDECQREMQNLGVTDA